MDTKKRKEMRMKNILNRKILKVLCILIICMSAVLILKTRLFDMSTSEVAKATRDEVVVETTRVTQTHTQETTQPTTQLTTQVSTPPIETTARTTVEEEATEQVTEVREQWDGPVLNSSNGVVDGPSGKETFYNLDMSGVISIMQSYGYDYEYWVREDGVKMFGAYVMCAANLDVHPRGSLVKSSLGTAIVCDTGGFAESNPNQLDIAVNW